MRETLERSRAEAFAELFVAEPESAPRSRAISATLSCFARYGVTKTTLDDVAREARCSRATLYRAFPGGKDELVSAVVRSELRRIFAVVGSSLGEATDLGELLTAFVVTTLDELGRNEALGFVAAHEPELVWTRVAFGELDRVLALGAAFLEPYLVDRLDLEDARRVGEWLTRLVVSQAVCLSSDPKRRASAPDAAALGRLVRSFVLPGVRRLEAAHHERRLSSPT